MKFALWKPCPGMAHEIIASGGDQDYCGTCMPFWGRIPVCPVCSGEPNPSGAPHPSLKLSESCKTGRCVLCRGRFSTQTKRPKRCPVCDDGACETKSEECGQ